MLQFKSKQLPKSQLMGLRSDNPITHKTINLDSIF